jgi:UDP-glucose 4-epimerase
VIDVIKAFESSSGKSVAYRISPRRSGDVAECYANPQLAAQLLGWQAVRGLATMCKDHWRWQKQNPEGFV